MKSSTRQCKLAAAVTVSTFALGFMAAPLARAEPPAPAGPVVTLQANAPSARLQRRGPLAWEDVCPSPCGKVLDPAATYRIGGEAIEPSDPFKLSRPTGAILVQSKTVSSRRRGAGVFLDVAGGAMGLLGAYWLYESTHYEDTQSADGTLPGRAVYRGLGAVGLSLAGVLLAVGLTLSLPGTTVEVR